MNLKSEDIESKKTVGDLDGHPVIQITTTGGLTLLVSPSGEGVITLGSGPHPAVSRHLAKARYPKLRLTQLAKSDWVDPSTFEHLLPKYEALTTLCNKLLQRK